MSFTQKSNMNAADTITFNNAVKLANEGQKSQAYLLLKELLQRNPQELNLLLWLAFTTPYFAEAEHFVTLANSLNPNDPSVIQAKTWLENERKRLRQAYVNQTPPSNSQPKPEPPNTSFSVSYGQYRYTDNFGQLIVIPLANFNKRFNAAVIDYIISFILIGLIVVLFTGGTFFSFGITTSTSSTTTTTSRTTTTQPTRSSANTQSQSTARKSPFTFEPPRLTITSALSFLYYVVLVALSGQTIGHRLMRIKGYCQLNFLGEVN